MDKPTFLLSMDENLRKRLETMAKRKKVTVTSLIRMEFMEGLEQEEAQGQMSKDWREITKRTSPERR